MATANVGVSRHTPSKHALMSGFVAREVRAANCIGWIDRQAWLDLNAGDGAPAHDAEWHQACSPGILAHHAAKTRKQPVAIKLYEKNPDTYGKLLDNLAAHLPALRFRRLDEDIWQLGEKVWLRAYNADSRSAPVEWLKPRDAVLVLNDPNAVTEWSMRSGFAAEIASRCKGLRILSTLGCNVNGIKRSPFARDALPLLDSPELTPLTERRRWLDLFDEQQRSLPARHDLLLARFERDSSQWAYLLHIPAIDRWREEAESDVREAFAAGGHSARMAWLRTDPDRFERIKQELVLTKSELHELVNTPLWGDDGVA